MKAIKSSVGKGIWPNEIQFPSCDTKVNPEDRKEFKLLNALKQVVAFIKALISLIVWLYLSHNTIYKFIAIHSIWIISNGKSWLTILDVHISNQEKTLYNYIMILILYEFRSYFLSLTIGWEQYFRHL